MGYWVQDLTPVQLDKIKKEDIATVLAIMRTPRLSRPFPPYRGELSH